MEDNNVKRRKLSHGDGGSMMDSASVSALGPSGASAFILETEELLKEVKVDYKTAFAGVDDTLRKLKETIESLDPHDPQPIAEVSAKFEKKSKITIPYPEPRPAKDSPYKLSFAQPSQVNVVGSYALKTMMKSQGNELAVDMIVSMPAAIFQDKDFLNFRYFYKRAYYLAYLTSGIREQHGGDVASLAFEQLNGNPLVPVLAIRMKKLDQTIRIIPTAPEGFFPSAKLMPTSSAVRFEADKEDGSAMPTAKSPTPFYNATLKADALFSPYLRLLHKTTNNCPSFKDACILGRIWLQQRGFSSNVSEGGFGHFEWAVLMALLLQGGGRKGEAVLSASLHSTQLFKATLQFLASTNLLKRPFIIGGSSADMDKLRQAGPVLYDAAREMNVLFKMTMWSAVMLLEQARWSLHAINDVPPDPFDPLFITKADQPLQMFDILLKVSLPSSAEKNKTTDCRGFAMEFSEKVYQTVKKALGDRAQLINVEVPKTTSWPVTTASAKSKHKSILLGISIDPAKASQGREYGPSYEQKKECAKFREFWGEKSDLWQFPDGNIVESLDWTEFAPAGPLSISEAIVKYILNFQLKLGSGEVQFYGQDISQLAPIASTDSAVFDAQKKAFETLQQDIRVLEDLPLQVKQISPVAPELRRAALRVLDPSKSRTQPLQPMEVVVTFEVSGKWPENLAAIQRAKVAFLLKIGSSLEEASEAIKTYLGLETDARDVENLAYLDVVYENGMCFRVRVPSDLEEILLERQTRDKTVERHVRTEASELLAAFRRAYTNLPQHTATISTFCTRFPALSSSIRLLKQWFASHKLACHFNEELVELFVLQAFLKPYPWQAPSSAVTGFLRTLLLLSRWDWRDEPLVIDHAESLSASQRLEINTRLAAWRKIDPGMNRTVMFVATSQDVSGTAYTASGPPKVVAARMTALARSACKMVREHSRGGGADGSKESFLDLRSLFQASLRDYDVLIHLNPKVLKSLVHDIHGAGGAGSRSSSVLSSVSSGTKFKNLTDLQAPLNRSPPATEHPTATLLRVLRTLYGSPLLFFHGGASATEDTVIAALWNPQLHSGRSSVTASFPTSFKPSSSSTSSSSSASSIISLGAEKKQQPGDEDGEEQKQRYDVNREGILAEIARIGGDLIDKVESRG